MNYQNIIPAKPGIRLNDKQAYEVWRWTRAIKIKRNRQMSEIVQSMQQTTKK
jgi:hypothetical protein